MSSTRTGTFGRLMMLALVGALAGCGGSSPCDLPFEAGPCLANFSVYAYVDGQCVPRTYGGCEGNDNRFKTRDDCVAACMPGAQAR